MCVLGVIRHAYAQIHTQYTTYTQGQTIHYYQYYSSVLHQHQHHPQTDVPLRTLPPSSFTGPLPSPSPSHFTTALSGTSTPALSRTTTIIPTPPYLSTMLRYLAQVGDVLSQLEKGPGEGLNYFDVLRERPTELLPRLVVQQVAMS